MLQYFFIRSLVPLTRPGWGTKPRDLSVLREFGRTRVSSISSVGQRIKKCGQNPESGALPNISSMQDLRKMVVDMGHEVAGEVGSPREAIHALVSSMPDVVLLDLIFKQSHGISILKNMLNIEKDAKIIMISGVEVETFTLRALGEGCRAFLKKPVNRSFLQKELEAI